MGKSRIAREALSTARSTAWDVRWAFGTTSARTLPLGAFASWENLAGNDTGVLMRSVIDALTSPILGCVVLGVDDVHLLDALSAFVLHQIVKRRAAKVVLTVRDGEPVPPEIEQLWQADTFDRLKLKPLAGNDIASLLSATLEGSVDPEVTSRLWELTRGNPLYLRNILEREVADGRLIQQHGCWVWTAEPVISNDLAETIDSRIRTLPTVVLDVIDVLAVGEPIELEALTRITDPAAVSSARAHGLITIKRASGGAEARLAHPLYGEVRRIRAAPTRLRRLRGLVATQLAASGRRDEMRVVVRRASLSVDSDLPPDPDLLIRAAQGAVWLADLPLADRLAYAAVRAGGGAEAHFVRAHALSWLSRGEESDAMLANIPTEGFTNAGHARLAFLRAVNRVFSLADPVGAKQHIDEASVAIPAGDRAAIDAFLGVYWATMGVPDRARQLTKPLVLEQLPAIVGAITAYGITVASGDVGRIEDAVAAANSGYAISSSAFDAAHTKFVIGDGHVSALIQGGRIADAIDAAERLRESAADLPGAAVVFANGIAGRAALAEGRLDVACSLLRTSVAALIGSGETNGWGYRYLLPLTIALAMRGATDEADASLEQLEDHRHPSYGLIEYERALAHAWVKACHGERSEAVGLAMSAAAKSRTAGQFAAEVVCLQTATQFGESSTMTRLHELAAIVEGPRAVLAARFAAGLRGDGAELESVSSEFERIGDLAAAVDGSAYAAMAYRRRGLRGSAQASGTRAEAIAAQCGGVSTPALRQITAAVSLTDREREIAMLIGEGLSSESVARRLKLSVRTVENHIYRAMAKAGADSRHDLVRMTRRNGMSSRSTE